MKRLTLGWIATLILCTTLSALTGEIVYLEGTVDIKPNGGELEWADFGTEVRAGDTLITGRDGYCEVQLEGGSTVTIMEDSIFSFNQGNVGASEPQNVFNCAMGEIAYKFSNLKDEPIITTPSASCGIRGTAFTVIAGVDGSSLFVVSEGEVEVESYGKRVSLTLDEAVEVNSGEAPGEKYPVLEGVIDFNGWLDQAEIKALENPTDTVEVLLDKLIYYIAEMDRFYAMQVEGRQEMDLLRTEIKKLQEEGKTEEAQDVFNTKMLPLTNIVAGYSINVRFYSLSALSLRRYTLGGLYVKLRTAHFDEESTKYDQFLRVYKRFLEDFNEICEAPYLVDADI